MHARTSLALPARRARHRVLLTIPAIALMLAGCASATGGAGSPSASVPSTQESSSASAPASPAAPDAGLFGSQDPSADGTLRQSLALLGLSTVGAPAPPSAVSWLVAQQCDDGSFVAYRANLDEPCPPADPEAFTGPDTNSTAAAALALASLGENAAAERAVTWLRSVQSPDGGWGYVAGSTPDSNSTGLALAALHLDAASADARAAGETWLAGQVIPCTEPAGDRWGIAWQAATNPVADPSATSQALLGLAGALPVTQRAQNAAPPEVECSADGQPVDVRAAAAAWLAAAIDGNGGLLPDAFTPGEGDETSTALAVVGFVATETSGDATEQAMSALQGVIDDYITVDGADRPAALGALLLAVGATGADPANFGGVDLTERLLATLRA